MNDLLAGYEYFREAVKDAYADLADFNEYDMEDYSYEDCVHRLVDHKQSVRVELPQGCSPAFVQGADQAKDALMVMIKDYKRSKEVRSFEVQF